MDFFTHQERARKASRWLVVLYVIAVVAIVACIALVAGAFWIYAGHQSIWAKTGIRAFLYVPWGIYLGAGGIGLATIAIASVYRMYELADGGEKVAQLVGGRKIAGDTRDRYERRLLNIVEEMSLAAGVPVPAVYVLDREGGINAFAAGWSADDAAIAVTTGTMRQLKRDELQGVIAHEFSHVLNGDMRLNIKLIGLLNGLLVIALLGDMLMDLTRHSRGRSRDSKSNLVLAIFLAGLALYVLGYLGVFFGNLIQAAVSRQREFLADASAVQFTRNPEGIGMALRKIGGASDRSALEDPHASQFAHMFFASGTRGWFASLMATHPPLDERITAVYGGQPMPFVRLVADEEPEDKDAPRSSAAAAPADNTWGQVAGTGAAAAPAAGWGQAGMGMMGAIGNPAAAQLDMAVQLRAALPPLLREAIANTNGAVALSYALLLDAPGTPGRQAQLEKIGAERSQPVEAIAALLSAPGLGSGVRLAMLDLAAPALKQMGPESRKTFLERASQLAAADGKVSLAEFALITVLERRLAPPRDAASQRHYTTLSMLSGECRIILSLLAYADNSVQPDAAFQKGYALLGFPGTVPLLPRAEAKLAAVREAMVRLNQLPPMQKPRVIKACLECVMADGELRPTEADLLRAVCASLDSPVPPQLDAAAVAKAA
jgi:Zn-dependent protease with chaperone function